MSNRPGIGATFIPEVASVWLQYATGNEDDVPTQLRIGPRLQPLGRYLTRKLREHCGRDPKVPETVLQKLEEEMQPLRQAARQAPRGLYKETLRSLVLEMGEGRYLQQQVRFNRKNRGNNETLKV